jgi:hypothetical protein
MIQWMTDNPWVVFLVAIAVLVAAAMAVNSRDHDRP